MARLQLTTRQTSRYPRRRRATPAPSYSDITDISHAPSSVSDMPDEDIKATACPKYTRHSKYPRRAISAPSYRDLTYISRSPSPELETRVIKEDDPIPRERLAIPSFDSEQIRSRYPRRSTPAPSYSDITEFSRSPSPPSGSDRTETNDEVNPEPWTATSSKSELFLGAQSSKPSDTSDDIIIVRPASPLPGFFHIPQAGLRVPRRASHASTEMSALTWLSRTPSQPSEWRLTSGELAEAIFEIVDVSEENTSEEDESGEADSEEATMEGVIEKFRAISKRPRAQTSATDDERPVKNARTTATPRQTGKAVPPSSHSVAIVSAPIATVNGGRLGNLAKLPQEIRQQIFAYAVDTTRPVVNKQCCGPASTKRERDSCKKHGNSVALNTGRFNLLLASKEVAEEASWVLHNEGGLKLELGKELRP